MIATKSPMTWGKYRIHDFHDYGAQLNVTDVIVEILEHRHGADRA